MKIPPLFYDVWRIERSAGLLIFAYVVDYGKNYDEDPQRKNTVEISNTAFEYNPFKEGKVDE